MIKRRLKNLIVWRFILVDRKVGRMKPQEVIDIVGHKSAFEATDGIMNDE